MHLLDPHIERSLADCTKRLPSAWQCHTVRSSSRPTIASIFSFSIVFLWILIEHPYIVFKSIQWHHGSITIICKKPFGSELASINRLVTSDIKSLISWWLFWHIREIVSFGHIIAGFGHGSILHHFVPVVFYERYADVKWTSSGSASNFECWWTTFGLESVCACLAFKEASDWDNALVIDLIELVKHFGTTFGLSLRTDCDCVGSIIIDVRAWIAIIAWLRTRTILRAANLFRIIIWIFRQSLVVESFNTVFISSNHACSTRVVFF